MQIKDVKEVGFYMGKVLYEVFQEENALFIFVYNEKLKSDDGKERWITDNISHNPLEFEDVEVQKVDGFKMDTSIGANTMFASTVSRGISYKERLEKIRELCLKESKALKVSKDEIGDLALVETSSAKFAKEILQIIEN